MTMQDIRKRVLVDMEIEKNLGPDPLNLELKNYSVDELIDVVYKAASNLRSVRVVDYNE